MNQSETSAGKGPTGNVERRGNGSRRKVFTVAGLIVGVMFIASVYVLAGESIAIPKSEFPSLSEPPPIGRIIQAEGPKRSMLQGLKVGEAPPDFSFVDTTGVTKKLSDYKGQAVMINFWATWCPYCVTEMPDIEAVYREEQANGLIVLGISLDDDADTARKFLQRRGVTFPSVLETDGIATRLYRVQPIPASFFIDREGLLRDIQIGAMTKSMIKNKVDKIL